MSIGEYIETCTNCDGEGVTHTGIEESPTTICVVCDGSGNKPAKCCEISADDQMLLDGGHYTPEELFGAGGKPSCPKCV